MDLTPTVTRPAVSRAAGLVVAFWAGLALAGCAVAPAGSGPLVVPPASPAATAPPPSPSTVPASTAAPAAPPTARLAVEGGDPVAGQLGTWTWGDAGSDGPWLAGTPVTIAAGEPLTAVLDPAIDIGHWTARSVAAGADGPAGATVLGSGAGTPAFSAPAPGAWTVELSVATADGTGTAHYFWLVTVTG